MRLFINQMNAFLNFLDQVNNKVNLCLYYQRYISSSESRVNQYAIYLINSIYKFHIAYAQPMLDKVEVFSAQMAQNCQPAQIQSFEQLNNLYLKTRNMNAEIINIYFKTLHICERIKKLGGKLLSLNHEATKFYNLKPYTAEVERAIYLYDKFRFDEARNIIQHLD